MHWRGLAMLLRKACATALLGMGIGGLGLGGTWLWQATHRQPPAPPVTAANTAAQGLGQRPPEDTIARAREAVLRQADGPEAIKARLALGAALLGNGRVQEAIGEYRQVARRAPAGDSRLQQYHAEAYLGLGRAYGRAGDPGEAATAYRQAASLAPRSSLAHYNLGNSLVALNQPREAIAAYRAALALAPDLAEAHANLGALLLKTGDRPAAQQALRQAQALRQRQGQESAAIDQLLQGIKQ